MKLHGNHLSLLVFIISLSLTHASPQLFRSDADDVKHEEKPVEPKSREGKSLKSDIETLKSEAMKAVADVEKASNLAREGKGIVNELVKAEAQLPVIAPPNKPIAQPVSVPAFTAFSQTQLIATPAVPSSEIARAIPVNPIADVQTQDIKAAAPSLAPAALSLAPAAPVVQPADTAPVLQARPVYQAQPAPVIKFGYSAPVVQKTAVTAPHAQIIPVANPAPLSHG